ncbi:hypothetical protein POM88_025782 [Heracleum sosnowskyi]|uniref:Uncharacterized protein n=1 Tax=Heracleum sosnowskyi TaxID=360622 RepID=A0AAD8MP84_9APIA|nr:hypothetical protein POM88_025782 [Heracleum sosnowskyi]
MCGHQYGLLVLYRWQVYVPIFARFALQIVPNTDASQCFDELENWESDRDDCSALAEVINFADNTLAGEARHEDRYFKLISSDLNTQHSEEANMVAGFRLLNLDGYEIQPSDSDCNAVDINAATSSSNIQSLVVKLMQEIDGLKGYQLKQILKLNHLEQELANFFISQKPNRENS